MEKQNSSFVFSVHDIRSRLAEKVYVRHSEEVGCVLEGAADRAAKTASPATFRCAARSQLGSQPGFGRNGPRNRQRKNPFEASKFEEHRGSFLTDDCSREHTCPALYCRTRCA